MFNYETGHNIKPINVGSVFKDVYHEMEDKIKKIKEHSDTRNHVLYDISERVKKIPNELTSLLSSMMKSFYNVITGIVTSIISFISRTFRSIGALFTTIIYTIFTLVFGGRIFLYLFYLGTISFMILMFGIVRVLFSIPFGWFVGMPLLLLLLLLIVPTVLMYKIVVTLLKNAKSLPGFTK